jgi:aminopeptidase N
MHMLRRRLGDDAFFKMLAELRRRYEFKTVTTAGFRALVREMRPQGLSAEAVDAFFENWVYATGIPALKLKYTVTGVAPAVKLSGTIEQRGVDDDFSIDTPVEIQNGKGAAQTIWVRTSGAETLFTANLRQVPTRAAIPDDVLMTK